KNGEIGEAIVAYKKALLARTNETANKEKGNGYPDVNIQLAKIYMAEELYDIAGKHLEIAEGQKHLLQIPDLEFEILYTKAELFYKQKNSLELFAQEYEQLKYKISMLTELSRELDIATAQVEQFAILAKQYNDDFQHVVKLQKKIGLHPKDALYGELRGAVHQMETMLNKQSNYQLLSLMLQLRRSEKDFMLRFDLKYLASFEGGVVQLERQIRNENLASSDQSELLRLLAVYNSKFKSLVDAQVALGLDLDSGALGRMRDSVKQSDDLVTLITTATKQQVESTAAQAQMIAIIIFIVASLLVMILVYLTSRSIIVPIERVYHTINEIRRNNDLRLTIEHSGKDEVTTMTIDFNSLINDFKKLIYEVNTALTTLNIATDHLSETTAATSSGMVVAPSDAGRSNATLGLTSTV
ncbi:hypothetical protein LCGC14_2448440, partial [marine sediment metagenome]